MTGIKYSNSSYRSPLRILSRTIYKADVRWCSAAVIIYFAVHCKTEVKKKKKDRTFMHFSVMVTSAYNFFVAQSI